MIVSNTQKFLTIRYQLSCMIIAGFIIFLFLLYPLNNFHSTAKVPRLLPLSQEVLSSLDQEYTVRVGFEARDFITFDPEKNDFTILAKLWFEYDPAHIAFEDIDAFSFVKADILKKSKPFFRTKDNGLTCVQYYLRLHFYSELDYRSFPLDDHRLYLSLISPAPITTFFYTVDNGSFKRGEDFHITGWKPVASRAVAGYDTEQIGDSEAIQYPKVVFSVDLSKNDTRHLFLILLPLLFIFFVSIFALSIRDFVVAISVVVAAISALIAYAFVMQSISPDVPYFMISDYLFLMFLVAIFSIFLTLLFTVQDHGVTHENMLKIRGATVIVLYSVVVACWCYIIFWVR